MQRKYWQNVFIYTIVCSIIISKSFFFIVIVTWGKMDDWFYNVYLYIGNWPSLITGTFTFLDNGHLNLAEGLYDIKSMIVNIIGWLPIGTIIGYTYGKLKAIL